MPVDNAPDRDGEAQRARSVRERLVREGGSVINTDGSTLDMGTTAITVDEGDALRRWVLREQATKTIEIGLAFGVSALHICEGLVQVGKLNPQHVAIDPFQAGSFANRGLQALEEAGVRSFVEHHSELSQIALPAFLKEGRQFDLAFVDGNHRFDSVFLDMFYLGRLVRKGGIIILDDYDLPGIKRAVSFYLTNLHWSVEELSPSDDRHSWVVLRTSRTEDARDFRYFVEF